MTSVQRRKALRIVCSYRNVFELPLLVSIDLLAQERMCVYALNRELGKAQTIAQALRPVSYTHLDVYKRQVMY